MQFPLKTVLVLTALCNVARINAGPPRSPLIDQFNGHVSHLQYLEKLYDDYVSVESESDERDQMKNAFIAAVEATSPPLYAWLVKVLTSSSDNSAVSLLKAALISTRDNLEETRELMDKALDALKLAAKIHMRYMQLVGENEQIMQRFIESKEADEKKAKSMIKTELQKLNETIWKKDFDTKLANFVRARTGASNIVQQVLAYLKKNYPFRAWVVVRYSSNHKTPRVVCMESDPAAHFTYRLKTDQELFIASADPTADEKRLSHAQTLVSRPKDSKVTGFNCQRYGETIYRKIGYKCDPNAPRTHLRHSMVGVLPQLFSPNEVATTHPKLLVRKAVLRHMIWLFCRIRYDLLVFA